MTRKPLVRATVCIERMVEQMRRAHDATSKFGMTVRLIPGILARVERERHRIARRNMSIRGYRRWRARRRENNR